MLKAELIPKFYEAQYDVEMRAVWTVDLLVCVEVEVEGWRMIDNLGRNHHLLTRLRHRGWARVGLLLT